MSESVVRSIRKMRSRQCRGTPLASTAGLLAMLGLLLLTLASAAGAHLKSYSYAWSSLNPSPITPDPSYAYNDGGGMIQVIQLGTGSYHVRFPGVAAISDPFEHVQVTAYGPTSNSCQTINWLAESVVVNCYDVAGMLADTLFTVLFVKQESHTNEIAYTRADQPTSAAYSGPAAYSFNPTGGGVSITRAAVGTYAVQFPGLAGVGLNFGNVQVTAYGATPARCKTAIWTGDTVEVRCFDYSASPLDSEFSVLFEKPTAGRDGLAFAWMNSQGGPATPHVNFSYNAGGGAIESNQTGTGAYTLSFAGFDTVGIDLGHVQVTAYGTSDAFCNVEGWAGSAVFVRCYDSAGAPTDSLLNVLFWKAPKGLFAKSYAFAYADQPTNSSYLASPGSSYNVAGERLTIDRISAGVYLVGWPGIAPFGSDLGIVMVSLRDPNGGSCKVSSWDDASADVRCFDLVGNPADRGFGILYMKPAEGTPGIAYAWASLPTATSYTPSLLFSHNPSGGAMLVDRIGTGDYEVSFAGYAALPSTHSHVQVTAYGSGSERCEVESWSSDVVSVNCYSASGTPVDTRFSVLYLRTDEKRDGLAFAWADDETSPFYQPLFDFSYNAADEDIDLRRIGAGNYSAIPNGIAEVGIPGQLGHIQLSTYSGFGNYCYLSGGGTGAASARCVDSAGSPVDAKYDVLFLRTVYAPESAVPPLLAAGVALLSALDRRRRQARNGPLGAYLSERLLSVVMKRLLKTPIPGSRHHYANRE